MNGEPNSDTFVNNRIDNNNHYTTLNKYNKHTKFWNIISHNCKYCNFKTRVFTYIEDHLECKHSHMMKM